MMMMMTWDDGVDKTERAGWTMTEVAQVKRRPAAMGRVESSSPSCDGARRVEGSAERRETCHEPPPGWTHSLSSTCPLRTP